MLFVGVMPTMYLELLEDMKSLITQCNKDFVWVNFLVAYLLLGHKNEEKAYLSCC